MAVYGLDFTSAPCRRKPLTCAVCTFDGTRLRLEELRQLEGLGGFEELLSSPGPWILGVDFPFGQPRKLIENLKWPLSWEGYVSLVKNMGKKGFEEKLREYYRGRMPGDILHKRIADHLAGAQSPMKLDFISVAKMFFQGAPRLAQANVSIVPCRPTAGNRTVVEAYPSLVARRAVGRESYKDSKTTAQAEERKTIRGKMLVWLSGEDAEQPYGFEQHYGFTVCIDDRFRAPVIEDDQGDLLDSFLCSVQAAWASVQPDEGFGVPINCDPIEGWIVDPSMQESASP